MGFIGKLRAAHTELAQDQALLIAAEAQANRRGDKSAAAKHGAKLDRIARQMRTAERLLNDETGTDHYAT